MAKQKQAMETENQGQNQGQEQQQTQQNQPSAQSGGQQPQTGHQQSQQTEMQARGGQGGGMMARRGAFGVPGLFGMNPFRVMTMSPFQLMRHFTEEMDRMFEDFGVSGGQMTQSGQGQSGAAMRRGGAMFGGNQLFAPQIEVLERDGNLVVRADLPGMSPENVQVELTDDGLLIEGERRSENTENQGGLYRSEVSYGSFRRLVPLPEGVNAENATANFNNGVLEVSMPAPQPKQQGRKIEIQGGASGGAAQNQGQNQTAQSATATSGAGGEQQSQTTGGGQSSGAGDQSEQSTGSGS